ncbi:hypothetical protein WNY61_00225 [Sulfitobacter sp. AS92]|uniref:hypothetical protein n=1 Tax=Sulfitobacter sp. AS92 TaxID=3135783 RepID=UPI0031743DF1
MTEMLDQLNDPVGWLVLAGAALQACACLFTNQLILRSMLFAGSVHYVAYYTVAAQTPLWPAILGTSAIALGNAIGFIRVLKARHRQQRREVLMPPTGPDAQEHEKCGDGGDILCRIEETERSSIHVGRSVPTSDPDPHYVLTGAGPAR